MEFEHVSGCGALYASECDQDCERMALNKEIDSLTDEIAQLRARLREANTRLKVERENVAFFKIQAQEERQRNEQLQEMLSRLMVKTTEGRA